MVLLRFFFTLALTRNPIDNMCFVRPNALFSFFGGEKGKNPLRSSHVALVGFCGYIPWKNDALCKNLCTTKCSTSKIFKDDAEYKIAR